MRDRRAEPVDVNFDALLSATGWSRYDERHQVLEQDFWTYVHDSVVDVMIGPGGVEGSA